MFAALRLVSFRVLLGAGLIAFTSFPVASATTSFTAIDVTGAGTSAKQGTVATFIDAAGDVAGIYFDGSNYEHGFVLPAGGEKVASVFRVCVAAVTSNIPALAL